MTQTRTAPPSPTSTPAPRVPFDELDAALSRSADRLSSERAADARRLRDAGDPVPTPVRCGPVRRAIVRGSDGSEREIPIAEIGNYVDESRNPGNRRDAASVEAERPDGPPAGSSSWTPRDRAPLAGTIPKRRWRRFPRPMRPWWRPRSTLPSERPSFVS